MASESVIVNELHTNCALSAEIYINENGHYYFRVCNCSDGSQYWYSAAMLTGSGGQKLEDAFERFCEEAANYLEQNMKDILK